MAKVKKADSHYCDFDLQSPQSVIYENENTEDFRANFDINDFLKHFKPLSDKVAKIMKAPHKCNMRRTRKKLEIKFMQMYQNRSYEKQMQIENGLKF